MAAAIEAGFVRFRPVLMTALAMIIGMAPMALGLGEGGEQNAPLGRAVIGGLIFATVATLVFVPVVFSSLHKTPCRGEPDARLGELHAACIRLAVEAVARRLGVAGVPIGGRRRRSSSSESATRKVAERSCANGPRSRRFRSSRCSA